MAACRFFLGAVLGALVAASPAVARCAPRDVATVSGTLRSMFDALARDDEAGFKDVLASDFYAFETGRRFDGAALFDSIKAAHAGGKLYRWTVTKPDVRIDCSTASIVYVNDGSVGDASSSRPQTWLESANLRFEAGRWRIAFLHSTRVTPSP